MRWPATLAATTRYLRLTGNFCAISVTTTIPYRAIPWRFPSPIWRSPITRKNLLPKFRFRWKNRCRGLRRKQNQEQGRRQNLRHRLNRNIHSIESKDITVNLKSRFFRIAHKTLLRVRGSEKGGFCCHLLRHDALAL